jgi:hypothetical protein
VILAVKLFKGITSLLTANEIFGFAKETLYSEIPGVPEFTEVRESDPVFRQAPGDIGQGACILDWTAVQYMNPPAGVSKCVC